MRLSLVSAVLIYSMTLTDLAFGGLVEVNSSQYLRESGNPQAHYLEVTLDNAGEIRVSNVNLQDGYIELAASTDVLLNGSSLMQPFSLPTGGSAVFPLEAGTHYLEVTLRGKPGGGLKVSFYEDKPDAPERGIGWEVLADGTVLHRSSGLIFHRNMSTPGHGINDDGLNNRCNEILTVVEADGCQISIESYLANLNSGVYGEDPLEGNAGYADWRLPSVKELSAVLAWNSAPPIEGLNGENNVSPIDYFGYKYFGGLRPYEPFSFCWEPFFGSEDYLNMGFAPCKPSDYVLHVITGDLAYLNLIEPSDRPYRQCLEIVDQYRRGPWFACNNGWAWLVRGGTPE